MEYSRDVKPLLTEKCTSCHGAIRQESGLRLDHGELLRLGGDDGPVVDLTVPRESKLLTRVTADDTSVRMPPEDEGTPLTRDQVRVLEDWIATGAASPDDEVVPAGPDTHWAWQTLRRPTVPTLENGDWSGNPIDAFVYEKLASQNIQPFPLADKPTLLRRLYFDMIGLPPTRDEQRAFLNDASANAWEQLVNRLLEDPGHGERWARHWMDVWRYSDWDGYKDQVRGSQRHIWRWRDWIIESINADKGYDQMIVEMLAGDEVAPTDPYVVRATGFLARNYHNSNRNIWLDATVEHTAKAFLAMTINCARCHDHKYDPLSQREYYAFRAIFEPHNVRTERLLGNPDTKQNGLARVFDAKPDEPTYLFIGGNEKHPDTKHPVGAAVPAVFKIPLNVSSIELPGEAVFPALRRFVELEDIAAVEKKLADARATLSRIEQMPKESEKVSDDGFSLRVARQATVAAQAELLALTARWNADKARYATDLDAVVVAAASKAAVIAERHANVEATRLTLLQHSQTLAKTKRSDKDNTEQAVDKASKAVDAAQKKLNELADVPDETATYTPVGKSYPRTSTGRRLALARWITQRENPLTARVAVNYVWMQHFGKPLAPNVFDFGLRSPKPIHSELLDWLAIELMEHQWSLKHLHRLIATSRTYQLASSAADRSLVEANERADAGNQLLWRANVRRLEAEVIRDSLIHVAGNLDRTTGGPDIDFKLGETVFRRSVYFRHAYEKQMTMLTLFDSAAPTECYRRSPSIIPQQALALANSPLSFDQSRRLAGKLAKSGGASGGDGNDDSKFVRLAFETLLSRECTSTELQACIDFLIEQTSLLENEDSLIRLPGEATSQTSPAADAGQRARESLIHTLMNHNDFVTIR